MKGRTARSNRGMERQRKIALGLAGLLVVIGLGGGLAWWCWHVPWFRVAYAAGSLWVIAIVFWYGISPWSRFGPPKKG